MCILGKAVNCSKARKLSGISRRRINLSKERLRKFIKETATSRKSLYTYKPTAFPSSNAFSIPFKWLILCTLRTCISPVVLAWCNSWQSTLRKSPKPLPFPVLSRIDTASWYCKVEPERFIPQQITNIDF